MVECRDRKFTCRRGSLVPPGVFVCQEPPPLRVRKLQGSCLQTRNPDQMFESRIAPVGYYCIPSVCMFQTPSSVYLRCRLLHLSRFSNGSPSVYQQVMIDDVIAVGQGPNGREAGREEGDAFFFFFVNTLRSSLRWCTRITKVQHRWCVYRGFNEMARCIGSIVFAFEK